MYPQPSAWDAFVCDLATEIITALALEVLPEFLGSEILGQVDFKVLCEDFLAGISGS